MSKPRIDVVLGHLVADIEIDASPQPLRILLEAAYVKAGVSPTQSKEYADDMEARVASRLSGLLVELEIEGKSATWQFNPSDETHVQGSCYVMTAIDSPETVAAKTRRRQTWECLQVIGDLPPTDFELLCRVALEAMGASEVRMTPVRADQGIDFYGRFSVRSSMLDVAGYPPLLDMLRMWVVGQAKQYPAGTAATFELRELVGAISLARAKAYGNQGDRYPDMDLRVVDPVIAIFVTSGVISRDARLLARRSGVLLVDGDLLAHILAWSGVGFDASDTFDEALLLAALQES